MSVRLLVETQKAVQDGEAAAGVRLFVAVVDLSPEVPKGATIKLSGVKRSGEMVGTLPYVARMISFGAEQVRPKQRIDWTVEDVAEYVVLAATRAHALIYLDMVPDEENVGEEYQGAFVSQARSCTFASLVAALKAHYEKQGVDLSKQFVWLDLFSANQPLLASPDTALPAIVRQKREALLTNGLHVAIDRFEERLIFFDTWDNPAALRRAWCVWEIYGSIRHDKPVQPVFAPGQEEAFLEVLLRDVKEVTQTFADIDTRNAQCFKAEDKDMIDGAIESQLKDGFTTLNAAILAGLRDWLTEITHAAVARAMDSDSDSDSDGLAQDEVTQKGCARVLNQAGRFLTDQGKYDRALAYFEEALRTSKAELGEQHPSVATTLRLVGVVCKRQGKYEEALASFEQALGIFKASLGEQHPEVANTLSGIARVYDAQGRYDEALVRYEEALGISKAELSNLADVSSTLNNIASVYDKQGRHGEALAYYEEALRIKRAELGEQHPSVAITLCLIGRVYNKQGRHSDALHFLKQSLHIRQDKLGEKHGDVAYSVAYMADVFSSQERFEEALEFFARALDIATEALPARNTLLPHILHGTAAVHNAQDHRAEALRLFRQALDLRKDLLGDAHPDTVASQYAVDALESDQLANQAR